MKYFWFCLGFFNLVVWPIAFLYFIQFYAPDWMLDNRFDSKVPNLLVCVSAIMLWVGIAVIPLVKSNDV